MVYIPVSKKVRLDAHNDALMKLSALAFEQQSCFFDTDAGDLQVNWTALNKSHINSCFYAAFSPGVGTVQENQQLLNKQFAALEHLTQIAKQKSLPFYKYSRGSLDSIVKDAYNHWAIQTIEGAYSVDDDNALGLIDQYADFGVKAIALVWNRENCLGGGTNSTQDLTPLGRLVIEKMEQRKILLDVSHMNTQTFWSAIRASTAPVIASHSGAYTLTPHIRNLTDEQLKAIADTRGVVNVVFHRDFIGDSETASIEDVADHIMYICRQIGPEHVGIGSDFDGCDVPIGLEHIGKIDLLDQVLKRRGLSTKQRNGILGSNLGRLVVANSKQLSEMIDRNLEMTILPVRHAITSEIIEYHIQYKVKEPSTSKSISNQKNYPKFWLNGLTRPLQKKSNSTYSVAIPKSELMGYHFLTIAIGSSESERKTTLINL